MIDMSLSDIESIYIEEVITPNFSTDITSTVTVLSKLVIQFSTTFQKIRTAYTKLLYASDQDCRKLLKKMYDDVYDGYESINNKIEIFKSHMSVLIQNKENENVMRNNSILTDYQIQLLSILKNINNMDKLLEYKKSYNGNSDEKLKEAWYRKLKTRNEELQQRVNVVINKLEHLTHYNESHKIYKKEKSLFV